MATDYAVYRTHRLPSTQDEARARFAGRPILVIADVQTAGRGRSGAEWLTAPAAVAASLALSLAWEPAQLPRVTLIAGLAAVEAVPGVPKLKWPNDLVDAGDHKLGGLLVESDGKCVVAGLGVNLWWPDAPAGISAVCRERPPPGEAEAIARRWADSLLARLERGPSDWGRDEYVGCCRTVGSHVTWDGGAGLAIGVDEDGRLVVEQSGGIRRVLTSGAVRHVRTATLPADDAQRDKK